MASNVTDPLESKLLEMATAYQQNYYEICSDWNRYESEELNYLRDYIGYAICGPPKFEDNNPEDEENNEDENDASDWSRDETRHFVYNEKQQTCINLVYEKVIEYANCQQSEGVVLCGIIYNVVFNKDEALKAEQKKISDMKEAAEGKKKDDAVPENEEERMKYSGPEIYICPWPVFKVRGYSKAKTKIENENVDKKNLKKIYYIDIGGRVYDSLDENESVDKENSWKIYYIDIGGRVYDGFEDYLENNKLPKCTMVFPKDGKYQIDPAFCTDAILAKENIDEIITTVWLEIRESPADNIVAQVLTGGDLASTVVTVASMGVGIAAMVTPIGAGVALASLIGGGASGLWTIGRSTQQLVDRSYHGESINVTDKAALGAWIGVAGGTMGLAATGSTVLLSRAVRTGTTVGRGATIAYDAVMVGSLFVNGVGVGYKSYDMYTNYMETGEISLQDLFFFTTHVFFFYNSVVNIRLARNIIETSQGQLLKDYEASLRSNRHRREFERIARNTRAAGTNDVSSNEEIIRGINKIANKDEFFQAMVRNRKSLSASGARASFYDGKVTINSVLTIDPIEFANLPKDVRVDIVKGLSSVANNNSPGIKPNNAAATKPNNSAATKPNNSAAPKPNNSAGIKSKNSPGIKPNNSASIKPDNSAGAKPNDSAATNPNNSAGVKPTNQANETSFKNYTANNGTILKEFCVKHSNATSQLVPPKIAEFSNVLKDLFPVQNSAAIFIKLLELGYRIIQKMPKDEVIALGCILAIMVEFLWDYIKSNIRKMKPGTLIEDPAARDSLEKIMRELWFRVEKKIDEWVEAFKQWLKNNFRQSSNEPLLNNRQNQLVE